MYKQLRYFPIFFLILLSNILTGQEAQFPLEEVAVSDNINVLDSTQKASLSKECKDFYRDKKIQIEIVLIPVAWRGNLTIEEYALELAEKRALGDKELDSGILILIVGSSEDSVGRGVRIEVGYGLEDKLTDSRAKRIMNRYLIHYLKKGEYYKACDVSLLEIKKLLSDFDSNSETEEVSIEEEEAKEETKEVSYFWFYFALFNLFIFGILYLSGLSGSEANALPPLSMYPICVAIAYLLAYSSPLPNLLNNVIIFLITAVAPPLMMWYFTGIKYAQSKDKAAMLNGIAVFVWIFTIIFLIVVSTFYADWSETDSDTYTILFGGVFLSVIGFRVLSNAFLLDLESLLDRPSGNSDSYSSGGTYYDSGSSYSDSSGYSSGSSYSDSSGYSSGSSYSDSSGYSSGGGDYSGGGGSFGGGGASGDW